MSKKRARDKTNIQEQLVEIFDDLGHVDEEIRLRAARNLLQHFASSSSDGQLYIVNRLLRGLCSGRNAARVGFSVALSEVLSQKDTSANWKRPANLVKLLQEQTTPFSGAAGQDGRDYAFGRLFASECIIASGILAQDDAWQDFLDLLVELAVHKAWLREQCGHLFCKIVQLNQAKVVQLVQDRFVKHHLAKSPEGVAVWLSIREHHPKLTSSFHVWANDNPLDSKNLPTLAKVLRDVGCAKEQDAASGSGRWTAKVHFVWNLMLRDILKSPQQVDNLSRFWTACVDESLFSSAASDERKHSGFTVVQQFLPELEASCMPVILSPNFRKCLTNQLAASDRILHRAAEKTRKCILEKVERDPACIEPTLRALMPCGETNFDAITKTKTIETLVFLSLQKSQQISSIWRDMLENPHDTEPKMAANQRQTVVDWLINSLIKTDIACLQATPVHPVVHVLSQYAYNGDLDPLFAARSQSYIRTRLQSLQAHWIKSDLSFCVQQTQALVSLIWARFQGPDKPPLDVDDQIRAILGSACALISKATSSTPVDQVKTLMLCLAFLQIFDDIEDAVPLLEELVELFSSRHLQSHLTAMVEVLLGLVAKPQAVYKNLAVITFSALSPYLDQACMEPILRVLETPESLAGQSELFDQTPAEDDVDDTEDSSDVESEMSAASKDDEMAEFDAKLAEALQSKPEESSESDMSDSQMFKLDAQLQTIFQQRTQGATSNGSTRKKDDRKRARENVVHLKSRVLDLVDVVCKTARDRRLPLLLPCLLALLRLIRTSRDPQLGRRASSIVREVTRADKKNKVREQKLSVEDAEQLHKSLEEIHQEAGREGSNAHTTACSQGSILLARVLMQSDREELRRVIRLYAATQEAGLFEPGVQVKTAFFTDWLNWCASIR